MMIYTKICSAFNFFIRLCWKSPFWLIADAKIQKITPSLKYLMEKEVLLAGDGMDFDEPRQTGAEEEVEEVKKKEGKWNSDTNQKSNEHFSSSSFCCSTFCSLFFAVEISWMFEFHFNRIKIMKEQIRDSTKRLWNVKPSKFEMWIHAVLNGRNKEHEQKRARAQTYGRIFEANRGNMIIRRCLQNNTNIVMRSYIRYIRYDTIASTTYT